ncbi:hypothetical protein [uncultured Ferrimonas sp.]|uniref:hypothetical protein n=1 Tax=uncultured Ferrimonas sp. TaxID=432640 RepID=UPI002610FAFF|nr:hypothetical protein [uncultured Ferrimonas sp.]
MSEFEISFYYVCIAAFAVVAPYLLLACLASGRWYMWPVGVVLFVVILTFLPPPVALGSCYLAVGGMGLMLLVKLWRLGCQRQWWPALKLR